MKQIELLKELALQVRADPGGSHQALLQAMRVPLKSGGAVLSPDSGDAVKRLMAFRHVFRHASIVNMDWRRIRPLAAELFETARLFERDIRAYLASLPPAE